MLTKYLFSPLFLGLVALGGFGCSVDAGADADGVEAPPAAGAPSDDVAARSCTYVTEADIAAVTGLATERVARDPMIGAGSTCDGNFAVVVGGKPEMVLLVDRLPRSIYERPMKAMTDLYTVVEEPRDLGAEARLYMTAAGERGAKVLYIVKGDAGVQLVSYFQTTSTPQLSSAQLLELGKLAARRL